MLSEAVQDKDKQPSNNNPAVNRNNFPVEQNSPVPALSYEERCHISRYGVWLLTGLCKPVDEIPEVNSIIQLTQGKILPGPCKKSYFETLFDRFFYYWTT